MKSNAIRFGVIGAICLPAFLGSLVFIRGMVPFDSFLYPALQKIFTAPTIPLFWLMDKIMEACGIHGEEAMGYLIPMFLSMLIYWAILGFALGWVLGKINEKRHNKRFLAIGAKVPQPEP